MAEHDPDTPTHSDPALKGGPDTAVAADRRQHPRVVPDERNQLAAKLASGSQVRLIDLSRGGAQFECERRFLPNASVTLRLLTRDGEFPVTGRVVRSRIVRLATGGLGYRVAVAFSQLLETSLEDTREADEGLRKGDHDIQAGQAAAAPGDSTEVAQPTVSEPPVAAQTDAGQPASAPPLTERWADITEEEALAFESAAGPPMAALTLTVAVDSTSEQLQDMFNGNNW